MRCHGHVAPVDNPQRRHEHGHDQQGDGTQDHEKVEIAHFSLAGDHNIGRIADQRRGPAYIRRKRLRHQKYNRIEFQSLGDGQRDRRHQQHGGHVIQHGREPGRQQRQQHQQTKRLRIGLLCRPDSQDLEETGLPDNVHDHHHPDQQKHDVIVHPKLMGIERLVLGQHAQPDHQRRPEQRHNRFMDPLGDDDQVAQAEDEQGERHGRHAKPLAPKG